MRVRFEWREPAGKAPIARVYVDANGLTNHHEVELARMRRVTEGDGAGVWEWSAVVRDDWRASYCFMPMAAEEVAEIDPPGAGRTDAGRRVRWLALLDRAIADPLNPLRAGAGMPRSIAEMPNAPSQSGWGGDVAGHAVSVAELTWVSDRLDVTRSVWVAEVGEPAGPLADRPLVVLLDGAHWARVMPAAPAFAAAVARGELPACVLVAIDSVDPVLRARELPCDAGFWMAVIDELLPQVGRVAPFTGDPARSLVAGQSYGGLAAVFAAMRFPGRFGLAASQSGSFWWPVEMGEGARLGGVAGGGHEGDGGAIAQALQATPSCLPPGAVRAVLDVGRHEGAMVGHSASVVRALAACGQDARLGVYEGGHDRACWRGALLDAVCELLGGQRGLYSPVRRWASCSPNLGNATLGKAKLP